MEPSPSRDSTDTSPPGFVATCRTMDSPRPVPPVTRLRARSTRQNRSKIRFTPEVASPAASHPPRRGSSNRSIPWPAEAQPDHALSGAVAAHGRRLLRAQLSGPAAGHAPRGSAPAATGAGRRAGRQPVPGPCRRRRAPVPARRLAGQGRARPRPVPRGEGPLREGDRRRCRRVRLTGRGVPTSNPAPTRVARMAPGSASGDAKLRSPCCYRRAAASVARGLRSPWLSRT